MRHQGLDLITQLLAIFRAILIAGELICVRLTNAEKAKETIEERARNV